MRQRVNPWWFRATVLFIVLAATVPRVAVIPGMTAFLDELFWLDDARQIKTVLAEGPVKPEKLGNLLRHPGVPVAGAAIIANLARDEHGDRVQQNQAVLAHGRYAIVWAGILCCVLVALLAARIYGPLTGGLAGLLLAASPFHIATSGWLQCDAPLTLFTIVAVLTFSIFMRGKDHRWLYLSGASCGLAIASKMPAVALLAVVGIVFVVQWTIALRARSPESWAPLADMLRWAVTAFVVLYLVWPRMWLDPMQLVDNLLWARKLGAGHSNYFLGQITNNPPWYYYLVVVPFRLSSVELLGLAAVSIWGGWSLWKRRRPRLETWILLFWGFVFLVVMSTSGKKLGARYVLPLWPILAILIARFCGVVLWPRIAEIWQRMSLRRQVVAACSAALLYVVGATTSILPQAPNLFAYANPLLGGLSTLNEVTMVYAVAEKRVAAYLETLPAGGPVLVAGHLQTVRWYTDLPLRFQPCAEIKDAPDYLVVFSYYQQRCPIPLPNEEVFPGTEIQSFVWDNATLARVYRLRPGPTR